MPPDSDLGIGNILSVLINITGAVVLGVTQEILFADHIVDKTFECANMGEQFETCTWKISGPEQEILHPIIEHFMAPHPHNLDESEIDEDQILATMEDGEGDIFGEDETE